MNTHQAMLSASIFACSLSVATVTHSEILVGSDLNSANGPNTEINELYSGNRGTNGGGDQSLQFGDQIWGTDDADVLVGGLGIDVLFGRYGDDVIIGGTEDFNPFNRDRAFGNEGHDSFIWAPGDGNDFFDGGPGIDVLVIALIGESRDDNGNTDGAPFFSVNPPNRAGSQDFDGIYIDPDSQLPVVDVQGGPGFCEVLDDSDSDIAALDLDHLVRFTLRGPAQNFENTLLADPSIDPDTLDTGLRISVHLKNTEFLVCGSEDGTEIEVFDLQQSPIQRVTLSELPDTAYQLVTP